MTEGGGMVQLSSKNWVDVVCWNPYTKKEFYEEFVCVENACYQKQTVKPGETWLGETDYSVKTL